MIEWFIVGCWLGILCSSLECLICFPCLSLSSFISRWQLYVLVLCICTSSLSRIERTSYGNLYCQRVFEDLCSLKSLGTKNGDMQVGYNSMHHVAGHDVKHPIDLLPSLAISVMSVGNWERSVKWSEFSAIILVTVYLGRLSCWDNNLECDYQYNHSMILARFLYLCLQFPPCVDM